MAKLALMIGVPGSGKSYYTKRLKDNWTVISRDKIRFSMLKDGEDYFAHEPKVFLEFCKQVNKSLENGENVVADATFIDKKSRFKFLKKINPNNYEQLYGFFMETPLDVCVSRQKDRKGREVVPAGVIGNMYCSLHKPTEDEGFTKVFCVKGV